jgi:hypothetical protein
VVFRHGTGRLGLARLGLARLPSPNSITRVLSYMYVERVSGRHVVVTR